MMSPLACLSAIFRPVGTILPGLSRMRIVDFRMLARDARNDLPRTISRHPVGDQDLQRAGVVLRKNRM